MLINPHKLTPKKANQILTSKYHLPVTTNVILNTIKNHKNLLYPKGHVPFINSTTKEQSYKKDNISGIDIINNLKVSDDLPIPKEIIESLYDKNLDNYIKKINNFDINDNKKLCLIYTLLQDNFIATSINKPPQTYKLYSFFDSSLDKLKKTDFESNPIILEKLSTIQIGNYDSKTLNKIIYENQYDSIPKGIINYIGNLIEPSKELENFNITLNENEELKKILYKFQNIENLNGKLCYEFISLLKNTNKDCNYDNLSKKELSFFQNLYTTLNLKSNDFELALKINNTLKELRPNFAIKSENEEEQQKEIQEKLDKIRIRIGQIYKSSFSQEQKDALTNILTIEDRLKEIDVDAIDIKTINENETLKHIFKAIPPLYDTIGKTQLGHTYTLEKHIISTASNLVRDKEYQALNSNDRKILLIAALMHDITKKEGGQDPLHPQESAEFSFFMLKDILPQDECLTISNLIYNHHFNACIKNNNVPTILAYECSSDKNEKFVNMLKLLGKADLKGNPLITDKYLHTVEGNIDLLNKKVEKVKTVLAKLKKGLELTPFPKQTYSKTLKNDPKTIKELEELKILSYYKTPYDSKAVSVIDLTEIKNVEEIQKQKKYLKTLGFGENTTFDNLNLLIHAISSPSHVEGIEYINSTYKSDAILSASSIKMKNPKIFNNLNCGFVFDSENTNIIKVSHENSNSGRNKTRSQIESFIEQSLSLSDEDIKNEFDLIKQNKKHSEILTSDISVSAVFVKKSSYNKDKVQEDKFLNPLFNFAKKYDIPVILIPD